MGIYGRVMVEYTERMLRDWADGQARDVQADMMRLTLEIVAKTLFDADIAGESNEVARAMEALMEGFTDRVNRFVKFPVWVPTPSNLRFRRSMRVVDGTIAAIVAVTAGRTGEDRGDLLSMLLQAQDDEGDGTGMTDRQLRDEAVTLFMAGHETTANTLAWVWYLLSLHPEAEARLHAELDDVLGGRPPEVADLPRLVYTDGVVTETLRLMPTVWLLGREALEPVEIGGYTVPRGMTLWMSQWVIQRDPRWFDDPEAFRPDRWADGLARRLHRYAYFPFGGGPRVCVGNHFARMEAVLLLATIARRFRPLVPPGTVIHARPHDDPPARERRPRRPPRQALNARPIMTGAFHATRPPERSRETGIDGPIRRLPQDGRRLPRHGPYRRPADRQPCRRISLERKGLRLARKRRLLLGVRAKASADVREDPPASISE